MISVEACGEECGGEAIKRSEQDNTNAGVRTSGPDCDFVPPPYSPPLTSGEEKAELDLHFIRTMKKRKKRGTQARLSDLICPGVR